MTFDEALKLVARARAALGHTPRWVAAAAIAVVAFLIVATTYNGSARLAATVERLREGARLRAAAAPGAVVAEPADVAELRRQAARVPELEAELARLRQVAPDAAPTTLAHLATGRVVAAGKPRLDDVRPAAYAPLPPAAPAPAAPLPPGAAGASSPAPCLLAPGDPTDVRLDEVRLETAAGNVLVAGVASVYRLDAAGEERIATGTLRADASSLLAIEKAPPAADARRYGVGPLVGATDRGLVAGVTLAARPLRVPLVGWQVEPVANAYIGPGGMGGFVSVLVRP